MLRRAPRSTGLDCLDALRAAGARGSIRWSSTLPAEPARFAEPAAPLPQALRCALSGLGIEQLYAHQAAALDGVRGGRNVVLATPTASGKTLAYNLPILEALIADPTAHALYVFPTNALANDQERALRALLARLPEPLQAAILTGATDADTRRRLRREPPRLLLTNPEMLHLSLLGQHQGWAPFLRGLRFVVLDELHLYRGLFGAHMAMVLRRLRRVAALHGARPRFVGCSATVGNPGEVAERLTGLPFAVLQGTGAARGPRTLAVWQPPAAGNGAADPQTEAVRLFCGLVSHGFGTILFALSRRAAEAMLLQARDLLPAELRPRIAPYRNGYTPDERRRIEERLKQGDLLGVVSTNALEVGIDVGGLDAAIIAGFPGSRTSFWQQAGRAGRTTRGSAVVFVPYERIVDAYYATHPEELLGGRHEDAVVDTGNPHVAAQHLACAALERPLRRAELGALSPVVARGLMLAQADGRLVRGAGDAGWSATEAASHRAVSLRGGAIDDFRLEGPRGEIGTIGRAQLFREAYPGAVYLHAGERFRVTSVDERTARVLLTPEAGRLSTDPVVQTAVRLETRAADVEPSLLTAPRTGAGPLRVLQATVAYREKVPGGRQPPRSVPLSEPLGHELATTGCWLAPGRPRSGSPEEGRFVAGLHALEHLLPTAVSLRLLCDARDVVAIYELEHAAFGGPVLFLYDACEGGAGIATRAAPLFADLLRISLRIVQDCRCRAGCPACIFSAACWRQQEDPDKRAALALLGGLIAALPPPA